MTHYATADAILHIRGREKQIGACNEEIHEREVAGDFKMMFYFLGVRHTLEAL